MKLYKLTRTDAWGYDDYDEAVVCAENESDAKQIAPNGEPIDLSKNHSSWVTDLDRISVEEIGEANRFQKRGVIVASFNAG